MFTNFSQDDLNVKGHVTAKDLVRIFSSTNPGMRVSYEVWKDAEDSLHLAENLLISGTLVRK